MDNSMLIYPAAGAVAGYFIGGQDTAYALAGAAGGYAVYMYRVGSQPRINAKQPTNGGNTGYQSVVAPLHDAAESAKQTAIQGIHAAEAAAGHDVGVIASSPHPFETAYQDAKQAYQNVRKIHPFHELGQDIKHLLGFFVDKRASAPMHKLEKHVLEDSMIALR